MRDTSVVAIEEKVRLQCASIWWSNFTRNRPRTIWHREEIRRKRPTTVLVVKGAWVDGVYHKAWYVKA